MKIVYIYFKNAVETLKISFSMAYKENSEHAPALMYHFTTFPTIFIEYFSIFVKFPWLCEQEIWPNGLRRLLALQNLRNMATIRNINIKNV